MQIKKLEAFLDMPLVEKTSKTLRLTPFGEDFAIKIGAILQNVRDLGDMAKVSKLKPQGSIKLGVIPTIAPYLFPQLIHQVTKAFPSVNLKLRETITTNLIDEVLEGRLDAAILALPVSELQLTEKPLFEEEFVLVRPISDNGKPIPNPDTLHEMHLS